MIIDDDQFDRAAAQVAGVSGKPATPLDRAADQVVQTQRTQLRSSLYSSLLENPDVAARATVLGRRAGLPADVVQRNLPDVQRDLQLNEYDKLLTDSPRLAAYLGLPQNAKMAHDDVPALGGIESTISAIRGPEAGFFSVAKGLLNSLPIGGRMAREGIRLQMADLYDSLGLFSKDANERLRQDALRKYSQASLESDVTRPEFQSSTASAIYGGGESVVRMAPGLAASILTRSPTPLLATAGAQTEAEAYGKYRARGATAGEALAGATGEGAVEVATELLPMGFLVKQFGRAGAGQFLGGLLAREVPSEQVATLVQDAIDTAVANPDKTWQQYLEERPGAAYQTLVSTITQGGIIGTASTVANRLSARAQQAEAAEQNAAALGQLNDLATASKLRARDADSFQEFVREATEDGPVQDVYINAATLAQSGLDLNAIAEVSPAVAEQFNDALATGGDIRIPVDEFAARLAGTEFAQSLLPHLKTDPAGMTQTEAQTFMQEQSALLQAEVERTLAAKQGDDTFKSSRDTVTAKVAEQLNQAGRFTSDVNNAYASMVGNFYAVQAARLGMTPEQLAERYPLQVRAERLLGAVQLDQSAQRGTPEFRNWFGDSKVVDENGAPLVVYHGTAGELEGGAFDLSKSGKNFEDVGRGKGFLFFTNDAGAHGFPTGTSAREYANHAAQNSGEAPNIVPAYVRIANPLRIDAEGWGNVVKAFDSQESDIRRWLEDGGYDGVIVEDLGSSIDNNDTPERMYVVTDPAQIKSAVGNRGTFDPNDPNILNQGARGSITLGDDITQTPSVITLLEKADLSTFLHESGHFFLEVLNDMAAREDAPAEVKQDMDAVLAWFGVPDLATWNSYDIEQKREHHEQFARGFEAYLFEGKTPNVEMAGVFQRFRAWLLNVYRSLAALNATLTDEVRGVFDRMLASGEQIAEAEAARGYGGLFENKPEFMTDAEWNSYQTMGQDATTEAVRTLETRSLRDMQWLSNAKGRKLKELQREAASKRKAIRAEVEAEVMAEPVNRVRDYLRDGNKLDADALVEMYAGDGDKYALLDWKPLGRMQGKDGLHPDIVAEQFGFTSGDHLVRELLGAERADEKIDGLTDQRMLERYGDLTDPRSIDRAADAALHDEARLRFVASEVNALNKAIGSRPILARAAKAFAEATIARQRVRDLKPAQYSAAAARAARAADAAFKKGDIETAAAEKRNQLVNSYADRAAHAAQTEVDKAVGYFKKFDSEGTRKSLDADYLEQIDALLARFDLRKGQTLRDIDRRKSLAEWAAAQREMGVEPDLPPELLDEAQRKSYRDMTIEELRGLRDSIKQIEHLARLKHKLLTAKDQREYEAIRDEIAGSILDNAGDRQANTRTPSTAADRALAELRRFFAAHIKAGTLARIMDGGKDGGPVWEYFIRSANEAGDRETTMRAEATKALTDILAPVLKQGKMGGKGQFFPTINRSLNREERIAIALNTGNQSNMQRLLGGEGWTAAQLQPVLDSLSKAEWDAVQAIWDHFEDYRPLIAEKERRVYGKEPAWLDPMPVVTPHGEYRGGYYPVKYDPAASQRAEEHADAEGAKRQLQGAYTSATTRRSFTKARAEAVTGRPLLYSLAGLYSGVNDVIHDLSWHEWLIDANRLLRSDKIDRAIREKYGPEAKAQFKNWVNDVAEGDRGAANEAEAAINKLRQNVSVAGLGFNVMSALMQGLGFTQSIVRVGPKWVGRGITQFIASPFDATREVNEKSEFMRNRSRTRLRELNELRNRVQGEKTDVIKQHAYVLMMRAQQMVDIPTWLGAYEKATANGETEERAAALADQAVIDAQGGGQVKDLAAIERGGPFQKLFTVFYSYMNTAFNLGVAETMTEKSKAKLAAKYLMLYSVPPVLGFMLKAALTPGDDEDDMGALAGKLAAEQLSYLMGLMFLVREFGEAAKIATGQQSFGYQGPAGVRMVGDVLKFGQQAAQGEFDDGFRKAAVNLAGDLTGLPAAQANRSITGAQALADGKTDNPAALALGYQEKR